MTTLAPATEALERAVVVLRAGGLVAFPTETVYGLGADARNPAAVARIFETKGRPADHPVIVHLPDAAHLERWAREVPTAARKLAAAFWPGPLTLVLPRAVGVPDAVTGGLDSVGLRVPAHPVALALLRAFDGGLAAPSANRYGRVSPTRAEDVREEFGDALTILDGGPCDVGIESTIVDLTSGHPRVLRPGSITAEQLEQALGESVPEVGQDGPRAPGRKPSHYAPRARVLLATELEAANVVETWQATGARVGLLAIRCPAALAASVTWLALPDTPEEQARALYQLLREVDRRGLDVVVAVPPPDAGVGHALRDRLRRAAGLGDGAPDAADTTPSSG
jgi:L-threonylcarbamoyladenylate synthase